MRGETTGVQGVFCTGCRRPVEGMRGGIGVGVWSGRGRGGGGEGDYRRRMGAILVVMSGDSGRGEWWTVCSGESEG